MANGYRRFGDDNMKFVGDITAFPGGDDETIYYDVYIPDSPTGIKIIPDEGGWNLYEVENPKIAIVDVKAICDITKQPVFIPMDNDKVETSQYEIFVTALPDVLDKPEYAGKFALSIRRK